MNVKKTKSSKKIVWKITMSMTLTRGARFALSRLSVKHLFADSTTREQLCEVKVKEMYFGRG